MLLILTSIGDALIGLSTWMTLNDLELPKAGVLMGVSDFFAIFVCGTHF